MNQSFPTLQDMASNLALDSNAIEVIRQPLYDYNIYPAAGILQLPFFQTAIGNGLSAAPGNATNPKTLADTNMVANGTLPAPQAYWVHGIEVMVDPGSSAVANTFALQPPTAFAAASANTVQAGETDCIRIRNSGVLTFAISTKVYYQEGPLKRFPSRAHPRLSAAVTTTSTSVGELVKARYSCIGDPVVIDPGIGIMTSQNFGVTLNWPVLVALPTNNARIGVMLNGWLFRAVQ